MRMIVNNIFNRRIKTLLSVMFVLFVSVSLYAVDEYISKIYKQRDTIFLEKSENALNDVLSDNNQDENYCLIENYTEKKIRRLIVNNDYDFAMTAIIIVIENNLDNEQAVEMYSIISEAYEVQKNYEAEQEQKSYLEKFQNEMQEYEQYTRRNFLERVFEGQLSVQQIYEEAGKLSINLDGPCYNLVLLNLQEKD